MEASITLQKPGEDSMLLLREWLFDLKDQETGETVASAYISGATLMLEEPTGRRAQASLLPLLKAWLESDDSQG